MEIKQRGPKKLKGNFKRAQSSEHVVPQNKRGTADRSPPEVSNWVKR